MRRLKTEVPSLLGAAEAAGIRQISGGQRAGGPLDDAAAVLGIARASRGETEFPGSIYVIPDLPPERTGGLVPDTGEPLAQWLGDWISDPSQDHNIKKLSESDARERHIVVVVAALTTAPFPVIDLLLRPDAPTPTSAPAVPYPITHVWVMSTWTSGAFFGWSRQTGWRRFDKVFDEEEGTGQDAGNTPDSTT